MSFPLCHGCRPPLSRSLFPSVTFVILLCNGCPPLSCLSSPLMIVVPLCHGHCPPSVIVPFCHKRCPPLTDEWNTLAFLLWYWDRVLFLMNEWNLSSERVTAPRELEPCYRFQQPDCNCLFLHLGMCEGNRVGDAITLWSGSVRVNMSDVLRFPACVMVLILWGPWMLCLFAGR